MNAKLFVNILNSNIQQIKHVQVGNGILSISKKDGCACIQEYKCCADECTVYPQNYCWLKNGTDQGRGFEFDFVETDCCGCSIVRCVKCPEPQTKEERCNSKLPSTCFDYKKFGTYRSDNTSCYEATCEPVKTKQPSEKCDSRCMKEVAKVDECNNKFTFCEKKTEAEVCSHSSLNLTSPSHCYISPQLVKTGGFYFNNKTCVPCTKWEVIKKSCEEENKIAKKPCHPHSQIDKKCYNKVLEKTECGCDLATCLSTHEEGLEFGKDEKCPPGSVHIRGLSICEKPKDLCKKCPPATRAQCTPFEREVEDADANGCKIYRCQGPSSENCTCQFFKYDPTLNRFNCRCDLYFGKDTDTDTAGETDTAGKTDTAGETDTAGKTDNTKITGSKGNTNTTVTTGNTVTTKEGKETEQDPLISVVEE